MSIISEEIVDVITAQKTASVAKMLVSALLGIIPSFGAGATMAFSAISATHYRTPNITSLYEPLDEEQSSWFVSILSITLMLGILSSSLVSSKYGYKMCLTVGCLIQVLGWVTLYFATTFIVLLVGRLVGGFGAGLCTPASYVYVSDIALIRFRGLLSSFNTLALNFAYLSSFILGAIAPFAYMIPISSLPLAIFFIFSWKLLQESPTWLIKKQRTGDAVTSLLALRGPQYMVHSEITELEGAILSESVNITLSHQFKYCLSRTVLMPLFIILTLFAFQASSGADTITNYSLDIFIESKIDIDPNIMAVLVQGSFTIGFILATPLMDWMQKRLQFTLSCSIMTVSYLALGFCLFFEDFAESEGTWASISRFLAPTSIVLSALGYSLGLGPIVYSLNGEILPPRVRGICCSLVLATRFIFSFALLKVFPAMVDALGLAAVFWIHSLVCLAATVFAFVFMPETKGKTLSELSNLYDKKQAIESKL